MSTPSPLDQVRSIKVKLGLLVAVSVALASVLATIGSGGGVPAWLGIPVTILVALGVTQLLAVGMTSPLRQMTAAARQMARGDYSGRVNASSSDEVGELARAFNRMAEDLATVDRQRRELVANVSHELRTPLTALTAVLENLVDGVAQPDPASLRAALEQAERLGALVTDLLDLSRVDAGKAPLAREAVPVGPLLEGAVAEARVTGREVGYDVRVEPADLTAQGDPARLRQLVANLLDNASRHSPAGGVITVSATGGTGEWRLEIGDQGPGISPTDRERVFERFGTLTDSEGGGGTGLGLAIARWVTDLHDGVIRFVDPAPGGSGACVRVDLPLQPRRARPAPTDVPGALPATPPSPSTASSSKEPAVPVPSPPAQHQTDGAGSAPPLTPGPAGSAVPQQSGLDLLFGSFWPEDSLPGNVRVLLASLAVGVLAGVVLPFREVGVGTFVVLLAAGAAVLWSGRHRRDPFTLACAGLCVLLASVTMLRDADWLVALCLFTGAAVCVVGLVCGRSLPAFVLAGVAWPLAGLRGLPWLGRSLRVLTGLGNGPAMLRTALWSLLGVGVFTLLFASADALFAEWASAVFPDLDVDSFVLRAFVTVAVGGVVLAAAYVGLNPPRVEPALTGARPLTHRFEWLAPVLLIDGVFALFLIAQATVIFGGHDYLERTTGVTYADYVHQGFGQLTFATALTLLVVWAAARKASRETPRDRAWIRGSLGLLCAMTLVVVASALYRMHVYQQAYGFTRLRLLVDVFEGWLGLLVVAVMVAGLIRRTGWLARLALLSGATLLVGLAALNPDAWIATQNIDRFHDTGRVDWAYLRGLSADALPTLAALPADERRCALPEASIGTDDWLEWNLGRFRARDVVGSGPAATPVGPGECLERPADSVVR